MTDDASRPAEGTKLDIKMARPRSKEGLFSADTGMFLRIEDGRDKGRIYTLSRGGVFTIGRDGADLALGDPKVSRKHAEIGLYGPEAIVLRDLASTNGTFVNGKRVHERVKLAHDDVVRVGDTSLRFTAHEKTIPLS